MTRLEELIQDYNRAFKKIGNSEGWRAVLLLYCTLLVFCCAYLLYPYTTGAAHTWCRVLYIAVPLAFLAYCAAMAVILFNSGALNRGNGRQKLAALMRLLEDYRVDWRDKDAVRKLIEETEAANCRPRLDLTALPRLAGLAAFPALAVVIRLIRAAPVPDLSLDILGKCVVVLEILGAILVTAGVFALLEWIAACLARQYREQASPYGVFSRQARQLLVFEPDYLEELLLSAQDTEDRRKRRAKRPPRTDTAA